MLDIAIIGGGPAGLAAGLYAVRGGGNVCLYEEMFAGGQIVKTHRVDNYPGISDGPDGYALAARFEEHAAAFGLKIEYGPVSELVLNEDPKHFMCNGERIEAKTVILATGASPKTLGIPGEKELTGHGVSYCATCDGAFYKNRTATVIGGGDTAISDALYLAKLCKKVFVMHRRDALRASAILSDAALKTENIGFIWNSVPEAFLGGKKLSGVRYKNRATGEIAEIETDGVFVAVGVVPRTELFRDQIALSENGSVITDEKMETNIKGVFAAGDVRNTPLRQVVTACADGAIAATYALEASRVK